MAQKKDKQKKAKKKKQEYLIFKNCIKSSKYLNVAK